MTEGKDVVAEGREERLELRYVPLGAVTKWSRNHKRHDIGGVMQSIEGHGMKDPSKFEPSLNEGSGGIVEGNGRDEVLRLIKEKSDKGGYESCPRGMYLCDGRAVPRGIIVDENGDWLVPILFGVDAGSQALAEAYAIDHNNLTISGGDFDLTDMMKMWETGFDEILFSLADLGVNPVSIDMEDIDRLMNVAKEGSMDFSDLDKEMEKLDGFEDVSIKIIVPAKYKDQVQDWLANGEGLTAPGMGKGVMKRCGLL